MSPIIPLPAQSPLSEGELCAWLGTAAPGDAVTYHRGALARSLCPHLGLLPATDRARLATLARRARKLADAGLAHLVQRRHGVEDFSYVLVAAHRCGGAAPPVPTHLLAEAA